jgi:hypothetical protein
MWLYMCWKCWNFAFSDTGWFYLPQRRCETGNKALKACTGKTSKSNKPKGDWPTCSSCKKLGHTKEKCWAPGGGAKKDKGKSTDKVKDEKVKVADTRDESNTLEIFITNVSSHAYKAFLDNKCNNTWIVNSRALAYMSSHLNWFETYKPISPAQKYGLGTIIT